MTAATAPGVARRRHRDEPRDERSSRTTMTKSISRSQVRLIASTNAIFGADEMASAVVGRPVYTGRLVEFNGASYGMENALMLGKGTQGK